MDDDMKSRDEDARETDESQEGATQPADTGEHSDAPGETGTGSREADPEHGKPAKS